MIPGTVLRVNGHERREWRAQPHQQAFFAQRRAHARVDSAWVDGDDVKFWVLLCEVLGEVDEGELALAVAGGVGLMLERGG